MISRRRYDNGGREAAEEEEEGLIFFFGIQSKVNCEKGTTKRNLK